MPKYQVMVYSYYIVEAKDEEEAELKANKEMVDNINFTEFYHETEEVEDENHA